MVVVQISGHDTSEMALVQSDHMIEAVASQGSDEPLDERVLPRTSWCAEDLLDPHAVNPPLKCATVDRIAISKEVFRRAVPWEGFDDLLGCPLSSRIRGDIKVQNLPSRMCKDNQHEEQREPDRWYDEKIDRYQVMDMILQKRLPRWRGRLAGANGICPPLISPLRRRAFPSRQQSVAYPTADWPQKPCG
jgi:hypothetical protein